MSNDDTALMFPLLVIMVMMMMMTMSVVLVCVTQSSPCPHQRLDPLCVPAGPCRQRLPRLSGTHSLSEGRIVRHGSTDYHMDIKLCPQDRHKSCLKAKVLLRFKLVQTLLDGIHFWFGLLSQR